MAVTIWVNCVTHSFIRMRIIQQARDNSNYIRCLYTRNNRRSRPNSLGTLRLGTQHDNGFSKMRSLFLQSP